MATPRGRDRVTHQALRLAVDVAKLDACFSDCRSVDERCYFCHVRQQEGVEPIRRLFRSTESNMRAKSAHILVKLLQRGKEDVFLKVLVLGAELEEASLVVDVVFDMRRSKAMRRRSRSYEEDMYSVMRQSRVEYCHRGYRGRSREDASTRTRHAPEGLLSAIFKPLKMPLT